MRSYVLYVVLLLTGSVIGAALAVWLGLALAGDLRHRRVSYVDRYPPLLTDEAWCRVADGGR